MKHSKYSYQMTTSQHQHRIKWMRNFLDKIDNDPEKKQRHEEALCPCCYYEKSRIGGARMTQVPCAYCETILYSGNTNVDLLCGNCASDRGVCRHCGGDLNLKIRRKLNF